MMQPLHHIIIHWGFTAKKKTQLLIACNTEVKHYIQSGVRAKSAGQKIDMMHTLHHINI